MSGVACPRGGRGNQTGCSEWLGLPGARSRVSASWSTPDYPLSMTWELSRYFRQRGHGPGWLANAGCRLPIFMAYLFIGQTLFFSRFVAPERSFGRPLELFVLFPCVLLDRERKRNNANNLYTKLGTTVECLRYGLPSRARNTSQEQTNHDATR